MSFVVALSKSFLKACVTLGPLGMLPASGTWGSAVGLIGGVLLNQMWWYPLFLVFVFFWALKIIDNTYKEFLNHDASEIILDEVVGCLITFLWLPQKLSVFIVGFLLFRFFDITKYCGGRWIEEIPGALGILLDDCWAGFLANLLIRIFIYAQLL